MQRTVIQSLSALIAMSISLTIFAAVPLNLRHQSSSVLNPFLTSTAEFSIRSGNGNTASAEQLKEISRTVNANQTTHIRVQQTYNGIPVFGADAVIHMNAGNGAKRALPGKLSPVTVKDSTMNGTLYQNLAADLLLKPSQWEGNKTNAINKAITLSRQDFNTAGEPSKQISNMMIFVDKDKKAHYAFYVKLNFDNLLRAPIYILDAQTLTVYKKWDDAMSLNEVPGGGFGGNVRAGRLVYDGMQGNLSSFMLDRDAATQDCYMRNTIITITDGRTHEVSQFKCDVPSVEHGNIYWSGSFDEVNGGYSPSNDALYAGKLVRDMFVNWFNTEVLVKDGKPMMLNIIVHAADFETPFTKQWENARWYENKLYLGDGANNFFPMTSVIVVGHEVSHGYTRQHANLVSDGQSGGINESFSDAAAQVSEFYARGKSSWMICDDVSKNGVPRRYMETPKKDCAPGMTPYECSIDSAEDYREGMNIHGLAGVYNRMFFVLSHTKGWDVRKAFSILLKANSTYWTSDLTFQEGACGMMQAAKDLSYDTTAVSDAFKAVDIDTGKC